MACCRQETRFMILFIHVAAIPPLNVVELEAKLSIRLLHLCYAGYIFIAHHLALPLLRILTEFKPPSPIRKT